MRDAQDTGRLGIALDRPELEPCTHICLPGAGFFHALGTRQLGVGVSSSGDGGAPAGGGNVGRPEVAPGGWLSVMGEEFGRGGRQHGDLLFVLARALELVDHDPTLPLPVVDGT